MLKMILIVLFFPIAMVYYAFKLVLSLVLGILRLVGLVDTTLKL